MILTPTAILSLQAYRADGGMRGLALARTMTPDQIVAEVEQAGLRGRGGAGFSTGQKWATIQQDPCRTRYVVCNGAEGEPGTFKDRLLMRRNPFLLLEGIAIAARAVEAKQAFVAIKRSFVPEFLALRNALSEMIAAKLLEDLNIQIVRGPEDYLFGEEKALMEVIEGGDPMPRVAERPPYVYGLFVKQPDEPNPTLVNNVETLCHVPAILGSGADAFRRQGTTHSPGTMVFTLCGDVSKQGVYELPLGTTLRELIEGPGGGARSGRTIKAVFSGVANAVILPAMLDLPMDFDAMKEAGTGLGAGGFIVLDDSACMVQTALMFSEFLYRGSCTQCISCKYGTGQSTHALRRLANGRGGWADVRDCYAGAKMAPHANRCYLPVQHSILIPSILNAFSGEVKSHFNHGCGICRQAMLPLIVDYAAEEHQFLYRDRNRVTPYRGAVSAGVDPQKEILNVR